MDKRYQVFISSTFKDLQEERQEIMQALLELDCIPAGMELFPAANETQWEIIKKVIADCDYYILILAGRYGSIAEDGLSYTEKEYDFALEIGKPVLAFTHRDIGKIPSEKSESTEIGKEKLERFKAKVEKKLCKQWESAVELGSVVSRSMIQIMKTHPSFGWVRGDQISDIEATNEILQLKKKIDDLKAELTELSMEKKKEIAELSQGEERFEIKYSFRSRDSDYRTTNWNGSFTLSWNEIIANVLPVCINEAKEAVIINQFNELIEKERYDDLQEDQRLKNQYIHSFKIKTESFHTVIIQLRALDIIKKSTKSKSVKDTATYWSLTELGDQQLVMLRAIRSREVEESNDISEDDE